MWCKFRVISDSGLLRKLDNTKNELYGRNSPDLTTHRYQTNLLLFCRILFATRCVWEDITWNFSFVSFYSISADDCRQHTKNILSYTTHGYVDLESFFMTEIKLLANTKVKICDIYFWVHLFVYNLWYLLVSKHICLDTCTDAFNIVLQWYT